MRSALFKSFSKLFHSPVKPVTPLHNLKTFAAVSLSSILIVMGVNKYVNKKLLHTEEIKDSFSNFIKVNKIEVSYNPQNLRQEKEAKELMMNLKEISLDIEIRASNEEKCKVILKTSAGDIKVKSKECINKKTSIKEARTVFDVTEYLKKVNKGLFDSTIVCYFNDEEWEYFLSNPSNKQAIELLLKQNKGFVRVSSKKTAKKMLLKRKTLYKYYKPSFVNGYGKMGNVNVEYWQAVTGECRNILIKNNNSFKEEGNVEFYFHKNWKGLPRDDRPLVCVYWDKNAIIWPFTESMTKLARKYSSECDFVFICDKEKARKRFHMGEVEVNIPYIFIVDPLRRNPIKSPFTGEEIGSYPAIYSDIAPLMVRIDDASKFIDNYFEGKLNNLLQSKRMFRPTLVKTLNKETFESEVLNNDDVKQCVIQVYKHNCASCYFNAKSFDALSWKLKKYGLWNELKLYNIKADNDIPQLGSFPYSPMYIYIRKGTEKAKNQVVEIFTLEPPQKFDLFKRELEKRSGLDLSMINLDPKAQFDKYIKKEDKAEDFNFDFDFEFKFKEEPATDKKLNNKLKENKEEE